MEAINQPSLNRRMAAALKTLNLPVCNAGATIVSDPQYYIRYEPVTKEQYVEYLEALVAERQKP